MQNRRSFLQSMAAAMSVAVVGVKPGPAAIERPVIDYSLFVDNDDYIGRYDVSSPWSVDGSIYATDCRIVVTHPGEWSGGGDARVPNAQRLQWGEFESAGWSPLGSTVQVKSEGGAACGICRGRGVLGGNLVECDECQGSGTFYPHHYEYSGKTMPCRKCVLGYLGGVKCGACNNGQLDWREEIGGYEFSPHYIAAIRTLGPVDTRIITTGADSFKGRDHGVLLFRGAGNVRGMLMSMLKDSDR